MSESNPLSILQKLIYSLHPFINSKQQSSRSNHPLASSDDELAVEQTLVSQIQNGHPKLLTPMEIWEHNQPATAMESFWQKADGNAAELKSEFSLNLAD
jgi:hypothetical protein